jgi:replicative DNA helicase
MNNKVDKSLDSQDSVVIAEYRLLNAIYLNKNALSDSGVSKDLLIHEVCKTIYDVIEQLYQQNIPISENAVYQRASGLNINVTIDSIKILDSFNSNRR